MMRFVVSGVVLVVAVLSMPNAAHAVAPPDFLFAIGSQIAQIFSLLLLGLSVAVGAVRKLLFTNVAYLKHPVAFWMIAITVILVGSGGGTYAYIRYEKKQAYLTWVRESDAYNKRLEAEGVNTSISFEIETNVNGTNATVQNAESTTSSVETHTITASVGIPFSRVDDSFFDANEATTPLLITNEEFNQLVQSSSTEALYVLDAREDEEYENGFFPGSVHIRLADLKAQRWNEIPNDRIVYVFCWSGIRSEDVAQFLRGKKIVTRAITEGANGWVKYGGLWEGSISIRAKYPQPEYGRVLTLEELRAYESQGVTIIDSRPRSKYNAWHIPNTANIPVIYTPTTQLEQLLNAVPDGPVITVCDDYVGCFDAMITGMKLVKKGHQFIGRYNKPWEYQDSVESEVQPDEE